jgi:hypothetical protein
LILNWWSRWGRTLGGLAGCESCRFYVANLANFAIVATAALPRFAELSIGPPQLVLNSASHSGAGSAIELFSIFLQSAVSQIRQDIFGEERAEYWRRDCLYAFETINGRVWLRFQPPEPLPHDTVYRGLAGPVPDSVARPASCWSHFKGLLYLENELVRQFYAEMCRLER